MQIIKKKLIEKDEKEKQKISLKSLFYNLFIIYKIFFYFYKLKRTLLFFI